VGKAEEEIYVYSLQESGARENIQIGLEKIWLFWPLRFSVILLRIFCFFIPFRSSFIYNNNLVEVDIREDDEVEISK
jgi:hypothetical protein